MKPRRVLACRNRETWPPWSFPPPRCNYLEQCNPSPLLLTGRRYLPYSSPTQKACLLQSANDPQDPPSDSLSPGYKNGLRILFNVGSPWSWPTVLRVSPSHKLYFPLILLQEGGPLPGPKTGLSSNTRKWIVRGDTCWQSKRFYWERAPGWRAVGKGTRRTALPRGLQSWVLWWWD